MRFDGNKYILNYNDFLVPSRREDEKDDLWTVFNILQEKVIKGGSTLINKESNKILTAKPVKDLHWRKEYNKKMWAMMVAMYTNIK